MPHTATPDLFDRLTSKISRVRRKERAIELQSGLLWGAMGIAAVWTVAVLLEMVFRFDAQGRSILFFTANAAIVALLVKSLAGPVARALGLVSVDSDEQIARRVGVAIPAVGDRLVNTLQLHRGSKDGSLRSRGYSADLVEATIAARSGDLADHDYSVIIARDDRRRAFLLFATTLLAFGLVGFTFGDRFLAANERLVNYETHYMVPAPFTLSVEPGDTTAEKGDSLVLTVRAEGIPPRELSLFLKSGDGAEEAIELRDRGDGVFSHTVASLQNDLIYRAEAGRVSTDLYQVSVIERPEMRQLQVTLTPPRYTGLPGERLPVNSGDLSGIRGSRASLEVEFNTEVATASIVQIYPRRSSLIADAMEPGAAAVPADTVRTPLKTSGSRAVGWFPLTRTGHYYIESRSPAGLRNRSPIQYTVNVTSDNSPSIALLQPLGDGEIDESMLLPTQVRIADDYGFGSLRIHYRLTASEYEEPWEEFRQVNVPIPSGGPAGLTVPYLWDLTGSRLVPGDEIEAYFVVTDNDRITGPKSARTGMFHVAFPSLEEYLQEAEQHAERAEETLESLVQQAEQTRQEMQELDRELMKQLNQDRRQADWQSREQLQEMMQRHEQMQQQLEQTARDLRMMAEKLQQADAISEETIEQLREVQELFEKLDSPELRAAMEKMQQEMQRMSPEQMIEAMRNFEFNEEQFRQAIERTKQVLEKMRNQQKTDELARRAEQLARKQEELNREMAKPQNRDARNREEVAREQEKLARQTEALRKEAEELSERLNESRKSESRSGEQNDQSGSPEERMENASRNLEKNSPDQQMRSAAQQMRQGNQSSAQQQGEQAESSLQQFAEQMNQAADQMRQESQQQAANGMRRAMQDLVELSKEQEDLQKKTENAANNNDEMRQLAREQAQMRQDLRNTANEIAELGKKTGAVTPEMARELGEAMKEMGQAQSSLEGRNNYRASDHQENAMSSMNQAAQMMQSQLDKMQNGQSGGGSPSMANFQQRLQQAAAMQQMINMAMGQQQGQGQQGKQEGGQQQQQAGGQKSGGKSGQGEQGADGSGGGQKRGQQGRKVADQQEGVRKSIQELKREARELGPDQRRRASDLEQAAREIEEVLKDLQSGRITTETRQRQDRILSRLLDAMKSERERDFEEKRESKPGVDVAQSSPGPLNLTPEELRLDRFRDELELGNQRYSRDYEELIRRYRKAMGNDQSAE